MEDMNSYAAMSTFVQVFCSCWCTLSDPPKNTLPSSFAGDYTITFYEIVDEARKTPEFKAAMERQSERILEIIKEWEEIDAADRARAERKKKKRNKDAIAREQAA
jgi:hypothetical protein